MDVAAPPDLADSLHVLVVASDSLARRALSNALQASFERATVDARASLDDASLDLDLALWDLGPDELVVPDRFDGRALPTFPVVALLPSAVCTREALAWGARAALPRDADDELIAAAIRGVLRGVVVIAPDFVEALLALEPAGSASVVSGGAEGLTAREREVLALLAEALPNKLIAHRLGISEHTVKFHVNSLMTRLGAQSRTDAVVRAARRGLLVL